MRKIQRVAASAGIVVAFFATSALCNEYKDLTEAAYCAGVLSRDIDLTKKMNVASDVRDKEQLLAQKVAFVEGALRQRKVETEIVNKFVAIGHADAQLCWDVLNKCTNETVKRSDKNVESGLSQRMSENCLRPAEAVCKRTNACN